ncbi:TRAP transporter small permease [Roseomonas sp. CCTCC AB2023176]|uniref:TRAP transporter small permease n=1 Tax=Roseomonas sp. CCTCC AB2023176 TaxID=3342640 RepID=UPI0035DA6FDB
MGRYVFKALEVVMVALLAGMVVMVFGNVVMRYVFNDGITVSEELSRYFFVWLTFIGAVVVMREGAHMGVDALVRRMGRGGRIVLIILSDALILLCCGVFFWGTWAQAEVNLTNTAPVTGLNMMWVYGVGFFTAAGMAALVIPRFIRAITGRISDEELAIFAGEGDSAVKERLE